MMNQAIPLAPWQRERDFSDLMVVIDGTEEEYSSVVETLRRLNHANFEKAVVPTKVLDWATSYLIHLQGVQAYHLISQWADDPRKRLFYPISPPSDESMGERENPSEVYIEWGYEVTAGKAVQTTHDGLALISRDGVPHLMPPLAFQNVFIHSQAFLIDQNPPKRVETTTPEDTKAFQLEVSLHRRYRSSERSELSEEHLQSQIETLEFELDRLRGSKSSPSESHLYLYREARDSGEDGAYQLRNFFVRTLQTELRKFRYAYCNLEGVGNVHLLTLAPSFTQTDLSLQQILPQTEESFKFYRDPHWEKFGFNLYSPRGWELFPIPRPGNDDIVQKLQQALMSFQDATIEPNRDDVFILFRHPTGELSKFLIPADQLIPLDQASKFLNVRFIKEYGVTTPQSASEFLKRGLKKTFNASTAELEQICRDLEAVLTSDWQKRYQALEADWQKRHHDLGEVQQLENEAHQLTVKIRDEVDAMRKLRNANLEEWERFLSNLFDIDDGIYQEAQKHRGKIQERLEAIKNRINQNIEQRNVAIRHQLEKSLRQDLEMVLGQIKQLHQVDRNRIAAQVEAMAERIRLGR